MLALLRRKHIAKIIFWGLVILIMPAFVLWGTGNIGRSKEKGPSFVGYIDNRKISFEELRDSFIAARVFILLNYFNKPEILKTLLQNRPVMARLAWDRLVILDEAKRQQITVSDREVIDYIRSHPLFSRNGEFDTKMYDYVLRYNIGLAARNFEEAVRANLKVRKMNNLLTKDVTVTDEDAMNEYKKENDKFKIAYILADINGLLDKAPVESDEMRLDAERKARLSSLREAQELHKKISELMDTKKESFEDAAAELGLKIYESPFFSKTDYIEGVGEASGIIDAVVYLKPDKISEPIGVRGGAIIFKKAESKGIDEDKFKKEKEEFTRRAMERKKALVLDRWFSEISFRNRLNINFEDIDKYLG